MMKVPFLFLFAAFAAASLLSGAIAAEPFLKPNDVIALVGGEDMVAAAEYGYLELLLTRALPEHKLKFRCLAWEGDTVFEQRRDLNFPTWEEQLEKIGATVVVCQFGQMESFAGKEKLREFLAAYKKLIERFSARGKRRVIVLEPAHFAQSSSLFEEETKHVAQHEKWLAGHQSALGAFTSGLGEIATLSGDGGAESARAALLPLSDLGLDDVAVQRDGVHLNQRGHLQAAGLVAMFFNAPVQAKLSSEGDPRLLAAIVAKNQLWDRYWRVQNWAFLAGDRTTQASSRDHLDPTKRWFPAEREQFLPLIEKKEQEIWAFAAQPR